MLPVFFLQRLPYMVANVAAMDQAKKLATKTVISNITYSKLRAFLL